MNRRIAYAWIFLILFGFILSDILSENFFILCCLWSGVLLLGCTIMVKYGWKQNRYLCLYWIITLCIGAILSATQLNSITNSAKLFPINHISTIWLILLGINFIISTIFSKIVYFLPLGILMLACSLPLDSLVLSYPSTTYGILLSIVLIGYVILSFVTPNDPLNLGKKFVEYNIEDENILHKIHKFKCTNCGYIYEGHEILDYCPRCMAGSDLLADVD